MLGIVNPEETNSCIDRIYLSKIHIKDFKGLKDFDIYIEEELTIITGLNGSGKSSILHALSTWPFPFEREDISREVEIARNGRWTPENSVHIHAELNIKTHSKVKSNDYIIKYWGKIEILKNGTIRLKNNNTEIRQKKSMRDISIELDTESKHNNYSPVGTSFDSIYHDQIIGKYKEHEIEEYRTIENYIPNVVYIPNNLTLSKINNNDNIKNPAEIALRKLIAFHTTGNKNRRIAEINNASMAIEEVLLMLWPQSNMRIHIRMDSNQEFEIAINVGSHNVILEELSSGQYWALMTSIMISNAIKGDKINKHLLILIDEPGGNMHLSALQEIRECIHSLSKEHQIIYTTHSDILIQQAPPGSLRIVRRTKDGIKCLEPKSLDQDSDLAELMPLVYAKRNEILKYTIKEDSAILIVEGRSEYLYLQLMQGLIPKNERWDPSEIRIVNADSITQIPHLLRLIPFNIKLAVLADKNDTHQQSVRQLEIIKNILIERKQENNLIHPSNKSRCDIEDVFDTQEFLSIASRISPNIERLKIEDGMRLSQAIDGALQQSPISAYKNHGSLSSGIVQIAQAKDLKISIQKFQKLFADIKEIISNKK